MQLSPARFDAFLNRLAQNVQWRRADRCPCFDPRSYSADRDCPNCSGLGISWAGPVACKTALAGQKVQRAWANFGTWENGDVVVTVPSDSALYGAGTDDRVLFSDSRVRFSRVYTKGLNNDRVLVDIAEIDRVFWLDGDGELVEGSAPQVAANGVLTWTSGGPSDGQQYTITGWRRPEYFVWQDFLQDRAHHAGKALPRRVVLRSFDMFNRARKDD